MTRSSWLPCSAVAAIAIARAMLASPPSPAAAASPSTRRQAFADVAAHEAEMRRQAARDFPADAWSQDDEFHQLESDRARTFARNNGVRVEEVLDAIDEGLRARAGALVATVPPCMPRPIY